MDGSDSDSSVVSLTITTLTFCYSDVSEWILDAGATYHVCSKQDWFASFEKLNDGMVQMGDDSTCSMDRWCRYDPYQDVRWKDEEAERCEIHSSNKEELYLSWSFGGTHGPEFSGRDIALKVLKGFTVVLKGVRRNNLYYLKGNIVTGQLETSVGSDDDLTKL